MSETENIPIKWHEEGTVGLADISFAPEGMMEYDPLNIKPLFEYSEVMPDNIGEACGIWYLNLAVP